jgi:hypothetical protein
VPTRLSAPKIGEKFELSFKRYVESNVNGPLASILDPDSWLRASTMPHHARQAVHSSSVPDFTQAAKRRLPPKSLVENLGLRSIVTLRVVVCRIRQI